MEAEVKAVKKSYCAIYRAAVKIRVLMPTGFGDCFVLLLVLTALIIIITLLTFTKILANAKGNYCSDSFIDRE